MMLFEEEGGSVGIFSWTGEKWLHREQTGSRE
jgi:hypothetical protein